MHPQINAGFCLFRWKGKDEKGVGGTSMINCEDYSKMSLVFSAETREGKLVVCLQSDFYLTHWFYLFIYVCVFTLNLQLLFSQVQLKCNPQLRRAAERE